MLDNLTGSNTEKDILKRIKAVRGNAEPEKPTEELANLEVSPDEVDVEEVEELSETTKAEIEPVENDNDEPQNDEDEELYVNINEREISFSQIKEWEQGSLRQSDYTRKTQGVADDRKSLEVERVAVSDKSQKLDDSISQLQTFIDEFNDSTHDGMTLEELRDIDPSEYLKITERQAKRKEAIKAAKTLKADNSDTDRQANAQTELSKLVANNPHWVKSGKETKAYASEMKQTEEYLTSLGMDEVQQKGILLSGNGQVFIDAAKYHAGKKSNASIIKKVRLAPTTTKPGGAGKSVIASQLEKARANHSKYGTPQTALALLKAQRKFKGE